MMRTPEGLPILKVGATRKHPIQRATELSAGSGVPGMFTVAYYVGTSDAFALESLLHEAFSSKRIDPAREFFAVGIEEAVQFARAEGLGLTEEGGEWLDRQPPEAATMTLSFSELFATFPDDGGGRELTPEERAKCRALEMGTPRV
jgi:hypothetical protein